MPYNLKKYPKGWKVIDDKGREYSNNPLPLRRAKAQMRALYANAYHGKGFTSYRDDDGHHLLIHGNGFITDIFAKAKKAAFGVARTVISKVAGVVSRPIRNNYPPAVRSIISKYAKAEVDNIIVRREPIMSFINTALNFISLGKWNEVRQKLNYDKLFHLSMVVQLKNPNAYLLVEKNEVINITDKFKMKGGDMEYVTVPVPCCVNFFDFMRKGQEAKGDAFFQYDAFTNNCQMFIDGILTSNGVNTPEIQKFILQDVSTLLSDLPDYVQPFARLTTNIAGLADTILQGQGQETVLKGNGLFKELLQVEYEDLQKGFSTTEQINKYQKLARPLLQQATQAMIANRRSRGEKLRILDTFRKELDKIVARILHPPRGALLLMENPDGNVVLGEEEVGEGKPQALKGRGIYKGQLKTQWNVVLDKVAPQHKNEFNLRIQPIYDQHMQAMVDNKRDRSAKYRILKSFMNILDEVKNTVESSAIVLSNPDGSTSFATEEGEGKPQALKGRGVYKSLMFSEYIRSLMGFPNVESSERFQRQMGPIYNEHLQAMIENYRNRREKQRILESFAREVDRVKNNILNPPAASSSSSEAIVLTNPDGTTSIAEEVGEGKPQCCGNCSVRGLGDCEMRGGCGTCGGTNGIMLGEGKNEICMPRKDYMDEHKNLIALLERISKGSRFEATKQRKEMKGRAVKGGGRKRLTDEEKAKLAADREAYKQDMIANPEKYKSQGFDPSDGGKKLPCWIRNVVGSKGELAKRPQSQGYTDPQQCANLQIAQYDESDRRSKAWEEELKRYIESRRSGADKFFGSIVEGLTKAADVIVKPFSLIPGVGQAVGALYQNFAPPGSEYYKDNLIETGRALAGDKNAFSALNQSSNNDAAKDAARTRLFYDANPAIAARLQGSGNVNETRDLLQADFNKALDYVESVAGHNAMMVFGNRMQPYIASVLSYILEHSQLSMPEKRSPKSGKKIESSLRERVGLRDQRMSQILREARHHLFSSAEIFINKINEEKRKEQQKNIQSLAASRAAEAGFKPISDDDDDDEEDIEGGRMPTWAITARAPQTAEQKLEVEKMMNPFYGQPMVECPQLPQVKARDGAVLFPGKRAQQTESGRCEALISGYETAAKQAQWRNENLGVSGFVKGFTNVVQPVMDVASFLPVVGSVARGISSGIDAANTLTDMAYGEGKKRRRRNLKMKGGSEEDAAFEASLQSAFNNPAPAASSSSEDPEEAVVDEDPTSRVPKGSRTINTFTNALESLLFDFLNQNGIAVAKRTDIPSTLAGISAVKRNKLVREWLASVVGSDIDITRLATGLEYMKKKRPEYGKVFDAQIKKYKGKNPDETDSEGFVSAEGEGKPKIINQLRKAGLTVDEYLKKARAAAKKAGYDPKRLKMSYDGIHKLSMTDDDGKESLFGKAGMKDFIIWQKTASPEEAEKRRKNYLARATKIKGDWKENKYSPNNLAIKILWG